MAGRVLIIRLVGLSNSCSSDLQYSHYGTTLGRLRNISQNRSYIITADGLRDVPINSSINYKIKSKNYSIRTLNS